MAMMVMLMLVIGMMVMMSFRTILVMETIGDTQRTQSSWSVVRFVFLLHISNQTFGIWWLLQFITGARSWFQNCQGDGGQLESLVSLCRYLRTWYQIPFYRYPRTWYQIPFYRYLRTLISEFILQKHKSLVFNVILQISKNLVSNTILQIFDKGSHQLKKKGNFVNKIHKTLTPPPVPLLWTPIFFFLPFFRCKKNDISRVFEGFHWVSKYLESPPWTLTRQLKAHSNAN